MRHRKAGLKLNRTSSHRDAMFRNMVTSLFKYERIRTTDTKAKGLRLWADHLITLAKRGDLHARRQALSIIREKDVVHKLFSKANERFGAMLGGYTRIVKLGRRPGDAALVSMIEFVTSEKSKKKKTKAPKSPAVKKKQVAVEKAKPEKKEEKPVEKIAEEKSAKSEEDTDKKPDKMELSAESEETPPEENKAEDDIENTEPEK